MKPRFADPVDKQEFKHKESLWDYSQPKYDNRSSCFINAGSHLGLGKTNPVGHEGEPRQRVPTLPYGTHEVMETSYVPPREVGQDYVI